MQAEVCRLPFPDGHFDLAVCANSFHYFRAPSACLTELRRVVRPGGRLVMVDWCDDYLACKLCSRWLQWTDPAFYRTYSLSACRMLLQHSGFAVRSAERFRIGWLWGLMRLDCRREG